MLTLPSKLHGKLESQIYPFFKHKCKNVSFLLKIMPFSNMYILKVFFQHYIHEHIFQFAFSTNFYFVSFQLNLN